jgi:heme-degrading monooxygenase HmoA
MFLAIAIHHPREEHVDDLTRHMHNVIAAVGDAPGLIEFTSWRDGRTNRLVGFSRWESEQAFRDALPAIGSLRDQRRDEWTEADDDLFTLTEI